MRSHLQSAGRAVLAVRELIVLALMGAILIAAQVALAAIPNVELVTLLIVVFTLAAGRKVFFAVYVFVLAEGLIFGFGLWWVSYLYIWSLLAAAVLIFRRNDSPLFWALVSGSYGLLFGLFCAVPHLFTGGIGAAISYWMSGILFDLVHCAGNFAAALLLFRPLHRVVRSLYARAHSFSQ